jgi:hypothetical protein
MSQWKKVTSEKVDNIANTDIVWKIGEAALNHFLKGEIFLINFDLKQTDRQLKEFTLYENKIELSTPRLSKKIRRDYLLIASYSDGSRGIFYNNMPLTPIKLDEIGLCNCWEKPPFPGGISEAFCYDNDPVLLKKFIELVDENTSLNEIKDEIYAYFSLTPVNEAILEPRQAGLRCN